MVIKLSEVPTTAVHAELHPKSMENQAWKVQMLDDDALRVLFAHHPSRLVEWGVFTSRVAHGTNWEMYTSIDSLRLVASTAQQSEALVRVHSQSMTTASYRKKKREFHRSD